MLGVNIHPFAHLYIFFHLPRTPYPTSVHHPTPGICLRLSCLTLSSTLPPFSNRPFYVRTFEFLVSTQSNFGSEHQWPCPETPLGIANVDFKALKKEGFNAVVIDKDNCLVSRLYFIQFNYLRWWFQTLPHKDDIYPPYQVGTPLS